MKRKTRPTSRTRNLQQAANMTAFLAQLQRSRRIHFVKALPKTSLYQHPRETATLFIPDPFVQDHAAKVGEWATLRVRTSRGRSSRSWPAHCCVLMAKDSQSGVKVAIAGGWSAFAADNRLQLGDFVVLVLREDAKSEFEVHVFRGPRAFPYFPDQRERSEDDEEEQEDHGSSDSEIGEETDNQAFRRGITEENPAPLQDTGNPRVNLRRSKRSKAVHQQNGHDQAFRMDIREESPAPFQHTGNPHVPPRFCKRLKASNVRGPSGQLHAGQFEFPNRFIRAHSEQVHETVKLQGIHENSLNYVMPCRRRPRNLFKVYFAPTDWSRFVRDNDLQEGQVLQFSLMADSYFLVRRIS